MLTLESRRGLLCASSADCLLDFSDRRDLIRPRRLFFFGVEVASFSATASVVVGTAEEVGSEGVGACWISVASGELGASSVREKMSVTETPLNPNYLEHINSLAELGSPGVVIALSVNSGVESHPVLSSNREQYQNSRFQINSNIRQAKNADLKFECPSQFQNWMSAGGC